jgi:hypothetical protein
VMDWPNPMKLEKTVVFLAKVLHYNEGIEKSKVSTARQH